ncbi:hypothetical protein FJTKL_01875 [Diaporthe vaccinii]|uniref:Uncharacterized protein n=1 Tax=Diaporthe vaccinii TaxID=105482 RepID=A0ABR4F4K9_9PEZI
MTTVYCTNLSVQPSPCPTEPVLALKGEKEKRPRQTVLYSFEYNRIAHQTRSPVERLGFLEPASKKTRW